MIDRTVYNKQMFELIWRKFLEWLT